MARKETQNSPVIVLWSIIKLHSQHIQIINSTSINTVTHSSQDIQLHLHVYVFVYTHMHIWGKHSFDSANFTKCQFERQLYSQGMSSTSFVSVVVVVVTNDIAFYLLSHIISLPFNTSTHIHIPTYSPPPMTFQFQRESKKNHVYIKMTNDAEHSSSYIHKIQSVSIKAVYFEKSSIKWIRIHIIHYVGIQTTFHLMPLHLSASAYRLRIGFFFALVLQQKEIKSNQIK